MPGVVPDLIGGLGNQLFIVAAAYAVHKARDCPLYLLDNPVSNNKHNTLKRNYKKTIFRHVGTHIPKTLAEASTELESYWTHTPATGFHPWKVEDVPKGVLLRSYYQYYPAIESILPDFCDRLSKGLVEFTLNLPPVSDATAFLHIRRGDYLEHPGIHFLQPMSYYEEAVKTLLSQNPTVDRIYIVSDDIAWAKQQPLFKEDSRFVIHESADELETFALMAQCKGGAICANSTYSWWGAIMGAHRSGKPVIVPRQWISDRVYSLFPSTWTVLG